MKGKSIGYIRVSTEDQNTDRQLDGMHLDKVFIDKASAKDIHRPQLKEALSFIREGDTLVVHSIDRLARNLHDLCYLTQKDVRVEFIKERLMFSGEGSPSYEGMGEAPCNQH